MSAQLPPPQPGPGGTWYPVVRPDGTPAWQWVPDAPAEPAAAPAPPPVFQAPAQAAPRPAPPAVAPPGTGARGRTVYFGGLAVAVAAAWAALFVLDRTSDGSTPAPAVAATASPATVASHEPTTPAEKALAGVADSTVDDKGDGTVVVTLAVPAEGGDERTAQVARDTYAVLQALANGEVEFKVVVVRGVTKPADGSPPDDAAPEVYKASFTSKAVGDTDFDSADRESLDGLRERSVNHNLELRDAPA